MTEVVCQLCDSRVEKSALESHISTQHLKVKMKKFPYGCPACDFSGPTRDWVERHQKERGHKGDVKDELGSTSYLADLTKLISTACEAAQNVGMSAVLDIFDNNLASGESFPTQLQQFNTQNFAVPNVPKGDLNTERNQIHRGNEDDPAVIDSDSDMPDVDPPEKVLKIPRRKQIRKTPVMLMGINVVLKATVENHSALKPAAKKFRKRPDATSNPAGNKDLMTEPIIGKFHRSNLTTSQSGIGQVNQQSTVVQKNVTQAGNVVIKRQKNGRFKCLRCGNSYTKLGYLQSHSYIHGNIKFPCDQCPKVYKQPRTLTEHKRVSHPTKILPSYRCAQCCNSFKCKTDLHRHLLIRHVQMEFPCQKCGRKFANPNYLQRHLKEIHPTKAQLKYKCGRCNMRFSIHYNLLKHSHVHSNVFHCCDECEAKFKHPRALRHHKRQKHAGMPSIEFQCDECQQLFPTRLALSQHKRTRSHNFTDADQL